MSAFCRKNLGSLQLASMQIGKTYIGVHKRNRSFRTHSLEVSSAREITCYRRLKVASLKEILPQFLVTFSNQLGLLQKCAPDAKLLLIVVNKLSEGLDAEEKLLQLLATARPYASQSVRFALATAGKPLDCLLTALLVLGIAFLHLYCCYESGK